MELETAKKVFTLRDDKDYFTYAQMGNNPMPPHC